jgi:Kef-type K+ transport system membrane component KefB
MRLLALLVLAGLLGPLLAALRPTRAGHAAPLSVPVVVGEIAAGILVGPEVLGWIDPSDPVARVLHDAGFALLMFMVGISLPLTDRGLRAGAWRGLAATAVSVGAAVLLASGLTHLLDLSRVGAVAAVLATSSAAVALPILRDSGGGWSGPRACVAVWILSADLLTVLALPFVASTGSTLRVLLASIAVSVVAAVAVEVFHMIDRSDWWEQARHSSKLWHWGLDLRVALALLFAITWMAVALGTSPLVAGFAAGVAVSLGGHTPKRLTQQLTGVGEGFLIPIFFVVLGASLDVRAMFSWSRLELAALLVVGNVAAHLLAARVTRLPFGAGLLATAQLGVPVALVTLGKQGGWLAPGEGAAFVAAALVSIGISALGGTLLARSIPPEPPDRVVPTTGPPAGPVPEPT